MAAAGSCSVRDAAEIRRTADRFLEALHAGDRAQTARLAPGMAADGRLEELFAAMAGWSRWSVTRVTRRGDGARAQVELAADGRATRIVIPLRRAQGGWIVDNLVAETTRLDFVPLDR